MKTGKEADCPCGSGKLYGKCCQPFHAADSLPATAEELMRSRYSAFCLKLTPYLFNSWHPAYRPEAAEILSGNTQYVSLEILETNRGNPEDTTGTVTFIARFMEKDKLITMREKSSFIKKENTWLYTEGSNKTHQEQIKANQHCPCGSGKKFKRCCKED